MLTPGKPLKPGAGADLRTPNVLDSAVKDRDVLRDMARKAEQELMGVQMASMDELTLLPNRHGFEALARLGLEACQQLGKPATLLFFDLDDFKCINQSYGRTEGDDALKTFADVLRIAFRESDVIGRLGSDEFAALLTGADTVEIAAIRARLEEILNERNATAHHGYDIRFSIGQIEFDPRLHQTAENLLALVDKAIRDRQFDARHC
ncbi:diguanylate cyclase (GGDEF) domain-containing protein [Pseudomonas sp. GM50]|jgi:diguanylate cyclase (GGDEF)-like protein|uniref:GGDEF domain-containing protein n=1 Tax=Pseudomonas sp. GM50 TaxID=1144332 RepID=UPI0002707146|nr:GGDEF domain-containing protein [Pseudomonas sp. GM50]EJM60038.1 diguanylate cyclase (GGDEF) domain-containing protein [Pseudomonas sp. GM50]